MFDLTQISRTTQQYVCMSLSIAIVGASLLLAAFAAESANNAATESSSNVGYTITIEQLS